MRAYLFSSHPSQPLPSSPPLLSSPSFLSSATSTSTPSDPPEILVHHDVPRPSQRDRCTVSPHHLPLLARSASFPLSFREHHHLTPIHPFCFPSRSTSPPPRAIVHLIFSLHRLALDRFQLDFASTRPTSTQSHAHARAHGTERHGTSRSPSAHRPSLTTQSCHHIALRHLGCHRPSTTTVCSLPHFSPPRPRFHAALGSPLQLNSTRYTQTRVSLHWLAAWCRASSAKRGLCPALGCGLEHGGSLRRAPRRPEGHRGARCGIHQARLRPPSRELGFDGLRVPLEGWW